MKSWWGLLFWWPLPVLALCFEQCPQLPSGPTRWLSQTLENPGFTIGYSQWQRGAVWVSYRLDADADRGRVDPRPDGYTRDTRTLWPVASEDFRGSGYDRGHLAPNAAMSRFWGRDAQTAAMHMSNLMPQAPRLNRGVWQRLEMAELDLWLKGADRLWVLAGPVYDAYTRLPGGVRIPMAYFRIWVRVRGDRQDVIGFVVPQTVCGDEAPSTFARPIAEIEAATGLVLGPLSALPEVTLTAADRRRLDNTPLRYANDFRKTPKPEGCER